MMMIFGLSLLKTQKINVQKSKRSSLCLDLYETNDNLTMKKTVCPIAQWIRPSQSSNSSI